jgi:hypothetical protein
MEAADLGNCGCSALKFPAVGSCSFLTDVSPCNDFPCNKSCITDVGVEVNGARLEAPTPVYGGNDPLTRNYGMFPAGQLSLVLAGCGHPTTRISLDGPAFPQATATADYVSGMPHVSWTTDTPSLGALLTLYGGDYGAFCYVQDVSDYTFTVPFATSIEVQPLGWRADVDTEFGSATIWRAGSTSATPTMP